MRLLLIEDDTDLVARLIPALNKAGYTVEHADNGIDGAFLGEEENFEAVILDLGLPDGLALPVIKTLRASNQALPILVLTAWDHLETKIDVLDAGAEIGERVL